MAHIRMKLYRGLWKRFKTELGIFVNNFVASNNWQIYYRFTNLKIKKLKFDVIHYNKSGTGIGTGVAKIWIVKNGTVSECFSYNNQRSEVPTHFEIDIPDCDELRIGCYDSWASSRYTHNIVSNSNVNDIYIESYGRTYNNIGYQSYVRYTNMKYK